MTVIRRQHSKCQRITLMTNLGLSVPVPGTKEILQVALNERRCKISFLLMIIRIYHNVVSERRHRAAGTLLITCRVIVVACLRHACTSVGEYPYTMLALSVGVLG